MTAPGLSFCKRPSLLKPLERFSGALPNYDSLSTRQLLTVSDALGYAANQIPLHSEEVREVGEVERPINVPPVEVVRLLTELLARQQAGLGDELLGVYLRGSLVSGDFDPATSDVDLLCVVKAPLTEDQFARLQEMHAQMGELDNPYAREIELTYLPRDAARQWRPGEKHATLGRGERLEYKEHGANWLLERWVVLNQGRTLYGAPPSAFIEPVSKASFRWAVQERLQDWAEFAHAPDDPAWRAGLGHTAYCIETMCRALYTLERGEMVSKPAALTWGIEHLPEPWQSLVKKVPEWRTDPSFSEDANRQAQAFILWAAEQAQKD